MSASAFSHLPDAPAAEGFPSGPPPPPSSFGTASQPAQLNSGVKLDRCPTLKGTENYEDWASALSFILRAIGIYEFVVNGIPRATDPSASNQLSQALMVFLQVLSDNIFREISRMTDPHEIWVYLENNYRRDSATSFVSQMRRLSKLTDSNESKNPRQFIAKFETEWARLQALCTSSKATKYRDVIRDALAIDEYKRDMLLASFEESHAHVVNNLKTKDNITYAQVKEHFLDLVVTPQNPKKKETNAGQPSASAAADSKKPENKKDSKKSDKDKVCTWCTKHSPSTASGHYYKNCSKLKEQQKKDKKADSSSSTPQSAAVADSTARVSNPSAQWIFDTGATSHMTSNADLFSSLKPDSGTVSLADKSTTPFTGCGTVKLRCEVEGELVIVVLRNVLLVPGLGRSLFSWRAAKLGGKTYLIDDGTLKLKLFSDDSVLLTTRDIDNHFIVNTMPEPSANVADYAYWHHSLGHVAPTVLKDHGIFEDGGQIPKAPKDFECSHCRVAKSKHRVPKPVGITTTERFDKIHSDICGPFPYPSLGDHRYFLTVIDDHTRFSKVYFLKKKSQAAPTLIAFIKHVQTQYNKTVKCLKTDNGGEYIGNDLKDFLIEHGIEHEFSPPYLHESNGTAERYNQTLCTIARAGMLSLPDHPYLWIEAIAYAAYTKNRLPHAALDGDTPYARINNGVKPTISHLRPFGALCYAHIPAETRPSGKLTPRALESYFVGYTNSDKIVRVFVPETETVHAVRDVTFPRGYQVPTLKTGQAAIPSTPSMDSTPDPDLDDQDPQDSQDDQDPPTGPSPSLPSYSSSQSLGTSSLHIPPTTPSALPPSEWRLPTEGVDSLRSGMYPPTELGHHPSFFKDDPVWNTPSVPSDILSGFSDDSRPPTPVKVPKAHPITPAIRRGPRTNRPVQTTQQTADPIPEPPASNRAKSPDPTVRFSEYIDYREPSTIASSSDSSTISSLMPTPSNPQVSRYGRVLQPPRDWWVANTQTRSITMDDVSEPDARSDDEPMAYIIEEDEPKTFYRATHGTDSDQWQSAIDKELHALKKNETWQVVDRPADRKIIGSKWVFKIKRDSMGNIEKYKARLVAKGFTQVEGLDYDELFAPVIRFDSLRLLLAIAATKGWRPQQMDVTAAFLYPELHEELYMQLPEGYREEGKVARLTKCIYGLKQSPREWYTRLSHTLKDLGFRSSQFDPCVFIHTKETFYVAVYVDDLSLFGPSGNLMETIKSTLSNTYEMKDLGTLHWLLGLEIIFSLTGIDVKQTAYIDKVLNRFQMADSHPCAIPIDPNTRIVDGQPLGPSDIHLYQSIVGSLMYAVSATRPDLCFPVTYLSPFNHSPTTSHLQATKRVLRYLRGTREIGLHYPYDNTLELRAFTDSDYANCPITRKSISGNIIQLSKATISWRSKKQKSVSTSTAEAEYQALSLAAKQAMWTTTALRELTGTLVTTPILLCDNKAAIDIASNPKISDRSKHIDVHFHFVREQIENGTFFIMPVASSDNLADICTKGLPSAPFKYLREKILGSG